MENIQQEDIHQVVCAAIRKVKPALQETELTPETRFDQYNISSIEMAMIVFEISDHFDLEIEPYLLLTVSTIGESCGLLEDMLKEHHPLREPTTHG